jgi:anti-sigma-K factor RskA
MNCELAGELADLYLYGELESRQEEEFEQHVHGCAGCRTALERREAVHRGFDSLRLAPPPELLLECRRSLFRSRAVERKPSPWVALSALWRRPLGALAMVALGFFASRLTPREASLINQASVMGEPILSTIRSVQPDASGHVQIALDETRRRLITGSLADGNIEQLMLAAVRDESNAGLRVASIGMLKPRAGSADVRDALLAALRNDPNPGVRMKALDGLQGMASQPEVRKTLGYVLQNDQNAGIRIQAIDLLTEHHDAGLVGILQQLVNKESNSYVRQRCEKVLQELNASVGTF